MRDATREDGHRGQHSDGTLLVLFTSTVMLDHFQRDHPDVKLERLLTR